MDLREGGLEGCFGDGERGKEESRTTYCVSRRKFLFRGDDGAGTLGFVQGAFTTDDGFSLSAAAAGFAADFGYCVPVVHGARVVG